MSPNPNRVEEQAQARQNYQHTTNAVVAAVASKDEGIAVPSKNQKTGSFTAAVSDLEPGQSASRVHRINPDMTLAQMAHEMREMKDMLRNNVSHAVKVAKQKTLGTYTIEVGESVMPGGTFYLVLVITRVS